MLFFLKDSTRKEEVMVKRKIWAFLSLAVMTIHMPCDSTKAAHPSLLFNHSILHKNSYDGLHINIKNNKPLLINDYKLIYDFYIINIDFSHNKQNANKYYNNIIDDVIIDNNTYHNKNVQLKSMCCTQRFYNDKMTVSYGITDISKYAEKHIFNLPKGHPYFQHPFMNSPLQTRNDLALPAVIVSIIPRDDLAVLLAMQLCDRPGVFDGAQKTAASPSGFGESLSALEITSTAQMNEAPGVYRLTAWNWRHEDDAALEQEQNEWGGALSGNQPITENMGLFSSVRCDGSKEGDWDWKYSLMVKWDRSFNGRAGEERPLCNLGVKIGGEMETRKAAINSEGGVQIPVSDRMMLTSNVGYTSEVTGGEDSLACQLKAVMSF